MDSITYRDTKPGRIEVRLNGRIAGSIHIFANGYRYRPRGSKVGYGDLFSTLAGCKRSLESDGYCHGPEGCNASLTTTDLDAGYCTKLQPAPPYPATLHPGGLTMVGVRMIRLAVIRLVLGTLPSATTLPELVS